MWTIKPNYNEQQMCFYCGKNNAVENKESKTTLYKIVGKGKLTLSVSYLEVDIGVPRCEQCYKRHTTASNPGIFLFIIGTVIGSGLWLYYFFFLNFPSGLTGWLGTFAILASFTLVWLTVCMMIGSIIRVIINAFMKGTKDEEYVGDYFPVKKLLDIGFMRQKPDAAAHYGMTNDFDKAVLENTFKSIIEENKCVIKRRR